MPNNYPPGMTRKDWDHVEGRLDSCPNCGEDLEDGAVTDTLYCTNCDSLFEWDKESGLLVEVLDAEEE